MPPDRAALALSYLLWAASCASGDTVEAVADDADDAEAPRVDPSSADLHSRFTLDGIRSGVLVDVSGHGHDAQLTGAQAKTETGRGFVRFGPGPGTYAVGAPIAGTQFKASVGFRVRAISQASPTGTETDQYLVGNNRDVGEEGFALRLVRNTRRLAARVALRDPNTGEVSVRNIESTTPVTLGSWHRATVSFDGQTLALVVDGVASTPRSFAGHAFVPGDLPLTLGAMAWHASGSPPSYFPLDGDLDDVAVWTTGGPTAPVGVTSLKVDNHAHPRLRWDLDDDRSFAIQRRATGPSCPSGAAASDGWCDVVAPVITPSPNSAIFLDPEVRLDPSDPVEHEYRVASVRGAQRSAWTSAWASGCETSIPAYDAIARWVTTLAANPLRDAGGQTIAIGRADVPAPSVDTVSTPLGDTGYRFLSNDRFVALFAPGGAPVALTNRTTGDEFLRGDGRASASSWTVQLNAVSSDTPILLTGDDHAPAAADFDADGETLRFTWNVAGLTIDTTWTLDARGPSPGLHGRIAVTGTSTSAGYGIEHVRFPELPGLGFPTSTLYTAAQSIGVVEEAFPPSPSFARQLSVGAISGSAQFVGLASGPSSMLYLAAEDPELTPKTLHVQPSVRQGNQTVPARSGVRIYPLDGDSEPGNTVAPTWDVVLAPMCGDWSRLAKRYRGFAQRSGIATTRTVERELPDELRRGVFWWTAFASATNTLAEIETLLQGKLKGLVGPSAAAGGVPVGFHLYNWHSAPFDKNPPQFEPRYFCGTPRQTDASKCTVTLAQLVDAVQADGSLVMPYIQSRLAVISDRCHKPQYHDTQCGKAIERVEATNKSWGYWTRKFFTSSAGAEVRHNVLMRRRPAKRPCSGLVPGSPEHTACTADVATPGGGTTTYDAWFSAGETNAIMDPSTDFWREVLRHNAHTVFDSGAIGLYLDSFGASYNPDFSPWYGEVRTHPAGHNLDWRDADREIVDELAQIGEAARVAVGDERPRFLAGEHVNEAVIGQIDLATIYGKISMDATPIVQAIYGDYLVMGGMQGNSKNGRRARAHRLAHGFLWGIQPGMLSPSQILGTDVPEPTCRAQAAADPSACDVFALDYVRALARARRSLSEILGQGELLGLTQDDALVETVDGWCADLRCEVPESGALSVVEGSRWIGVDGQRYLIVTNSSDTPHTAHLPLAANWRGLHASCMDESLRPAACGTEARPEAMVTVTVPAAGVRVIRLW